MILYNCKWLPVGGMTIFPPLILVKSKKGEDPCLVEHEKVHVDQCMVLSPVIFGCIVWPIGWIRWWAKYVYDFIGCWIKTKSFYQARHLIPYEVEAYDRQQQCAMDIRKRTTYRIR